MLERKAKIALIDSEGMPVYGNLNHGGALMDSAYLPFIERALMNNSRVKIKILIAALAFMLWSTPSSRALAQETQPGDACTGANRFLHAGGPENPGAGLLLVCDGSVWRRVTEWDTSGNLGVKQAAPKAPLHVGGEAIVGSTGLVCNADREGGLRWSSANGTIEMCDGASWQKIAVNTCDNAPAFPVFTDQDELAGSTLVTSNIVEITGMDAGCSATVGVSGTGGNPQYRVCSDAACSSEIQTWTASNTAQTMQGNYIQLRATSSASSGTTFTITASIGPVSSDWAITTGISGCSPVGTICSDGSVYAGLSPDGNVPMYIARCDLGQTWDGAACTGTASSLPWNAGDTGWVDTPLVNCASAAGCDASGETNTATLVATDASTNAGTQDHVAARECDNLNVHGKTDWYLPSARELDLIYDNLVDATPANNAPDPLITGFETSGGQYWSSSEYDISPAWRQRFSDGSQTNSNKYYLYRVRCARR
ncbi:MAG: DUF1566 domain-containing protein [Micavibrio aeruginosavorus]|uniref:DUF1566 domain-containing protein n=1 Tax=Micavibrio aeruginosavorus TaxID=349221 RepID=A0A7T5R3E3_9BACT|nr:MAG: DUF1566 domain-containing protein [Micavibrio aeruginosavorus]